MSSDYILAIDLGTSGPKVGILTLKGEIIAWAFEPNEVILLPHGGAEQNPHAWWSAICAATHRALAQAAVPIERIVGISASAHWSGTVAVGQDGQPLGNALIWMDTRGAPYIKQVTKGLLKIQGYGLARLIPWLHLTGGMPSLTGKDPLAHILFLKHQFPEIYRNTAVFLEPTDYLTMRLTGRVAASFGSIILHWVTDNRNIRQIKYSPLLLALAGLDRKKLPDLRHASEILGPLTAEAASELGLLPGTPVIVGTPDLQAATLGSGAVRDFQAHTYLGSSSWLLCHVPYKRTDPFHNMTTLPSPIPERYLLTNEQECAGICLSFLRDKLLFADDELYTARPDAIYQTFDRMAARTAAGSNGVLFTPWLYGERTPIEDYTVRGGFHNLSLSTTRADLVRSVLEGVAYNSRWLLHAVEFCIRRRVDHIHMIGGGAQSAVWCQIYADVLNRSIHQLRDPNLANMRGAAMLTAVALGRSSFQQMAAQVPIAQTFRPNPANRQVYDQMFREFRHLYHATRSMYARLNRSK